jgi:hypothetical protein
MFEFWCEYDINPLIIFNPKGEILYCNQEAEILLSYINKKEIFQFTIQNAPLNPGIKTEFKKIEFKDFKFTGYSIGYKDEKSIGVRFFINTNINTPQLEELELIDINTLINFAIEYTKLNQNTEFKIYIDPSIPSAYINKNALLNLLFEIFENQSHIYIQTKINLGEYIKIGNKKYQILEVNIKCKNKKRIKNQFFEVINKKDGYTIQIPLIKEKNENSIA